MKEGLVAFMVTWVTHNTRISERMVEYGVRLGKPVRLSLVNEILISQYILEIVREDSLKVLAYNICKDHVHIILVCHPQKLNNIVRKLKGKSSQLLKNHQRIPANQKFTLWAQKFHRRVIHNDWYLQNAIYYVIHNRTKHRLPANNGLQPIVQLMLCDQDTAFCSPLSS